MTDAVASYQSYIICTSPRSGSTLLCKLLAATEKSGKPDSHFHSPSLSDWAGYYQISTDDFSNERNLLTEIFQAAHARGSGNTGIFGLRLQRGSFNFFMHKLYVLCKSGSSESDVERIQRVFGNTLFIHLSRHNKLEQAISLLKANQTGLWHKLEDGTELKRTVSRQEPIYDAQAIARNLAELTDLDALWNSWFFDQSLEPLRISYEELSAGPANVLAELLGHLEVDREHAEVIALPMVKMADVTSRLWEKRFLSETV